MGRNEQKMKIDKNSVNYLKHQLDKVYELLNQIPESKIKGTVAYNIVFELENINMRFSIPFND